MKKTTEQFKKEVFELTGNEFEVLGEYINSYTKIKIKHNVCGNVFLQFPTTFIKGKIRCPKCAKNLKKTTGDFKKEVFNIFGDEYEVLGEYINNHTKIEIKHNVCGKTYSTLPTVILQGHKCPHCNSLHKTSFENIKQEIFNLVGNEYSVLDCDGASKITLKHNICGYTYPVTRGNFVNKGYRCQYCQGNYQKTTEEVQAKIQEQLGEEYKIIEDYKKSEEKIAILHTKCGKSFKVRPSDLLRNVHKCPFCDPPNISSLEKELADFIKNDLKEDIIEGDRKILKRKRNRYFNS
jgi:hypothetical protein